jgi:hypothetical protein
MPVFIFAGKVGRGWGWIASLRSQWLDFVMSRGETVCGKMVIWKRGIML